MLQILSEKTDSQTYTIISNVTDVAKALLNAKTNAIYESLNATII
ncbi:MAG: hypothetical protein WA816_12315 [Bacteroidales bacterium]